MNRIDRNLKQLLRRETYFYCIVILGLAVAAFVYRSYALSAAAAAVAVILFLITIFTSRSHAKGIAAYVQQSVDALSDSAAIDAPSPMFTVRLSDGEILWHNRSFSQIIGNKNRFIGTKITEILPEFSTQWLSSGRTEAETDQTVKNRRYHVLGYAERAHGEPTVGLVQMVDTTELLNTRDEYLRSRPVVSIILIDNYDDLTNNLPDSTVSALNAQLNKRINNWAESIGGMLRRLERNRFLFLFEVKDLHRVTEEKFSLLEDIKHVTGPSGIAATVSIGLGKDGVGYQENYDYAALALEMALSRGGDQAVIKDKFDFSFYGGRTSEAERNTKVKSRVVASSLAALIEQSSNVFVMGHRNADADAIGAAAGVCCLCREKGKRAFIVTDLKNNSAGRLIDMLREDASYKDRFITAQDAIVMADAKSLLVVVDTNRPEQVESRPLLESMTRVAVIDHHRRAADYISNAVLNYHEPFASSAAELVTEILTYAVNPGHILSCELRALLAGIVLDTKHFSVRVGSRTFEAAAFLRRMGADTVAVKRLFQNDFDSTVSRYQIVEHAKVYRDSIAVAAVDREVERSVAGQAADELLSIDGIETSFVLFRQKDAVFLSARSIGSMNVQMVLEPLGGGGNAATAGAQLKNAGIDEAQKLLLDAIDTYLAGN